MVVARSNLSCSGGTTVQFEETRSTWRVLEGSDHSTNWHACWPFWPIFSYAMEAMDQQRVTIERFLAYAFLDSLKKLPDKVHESSWWKCVFFVSLPFYVLAVLLYLIVAPILGGLRLAVTHADRVVFVLASSFLSFYQVPLKVFYIYMAVLAFTGFLQFLRYNSSVRERFLHYLSCISCGTSNMFLRKFTTLHFSNPFNRCLITSKVVYVPIGLELPSRFSGCEAFDFPISEELNFDSIVGICRINIETLGDIVTSTIRLFCVDAPWGRNCFTISMENDNLGRLISYFNRVVETDCKELICTFVGYDVRALSILGIVKHFNSRLQLVKLERYSPDIFTIC